MTIFSQARGVGGNTPPTPFDQNPAWKEINKQLNANVQFTIAPAADYGTKLAAIMAGGDLPDIIFFQGGLGGTNATSSTVGASATTNLPAFLQHSMADLTPYLAGDADQGLSQPGGDPDVRLEELRLRLRRPPVHVAGRALPAAEHDVPQHGASGTRRSVQTTCPKTPTTSSACCCS